MFFRYEERNQGIFRLRNTKYLLPEVYPKRMAKGSLLSSYKGACSPPGSSVHEDSPGKNTGVGCQACLQGIFPTQG